MTQNLNQEEQMKLIQKLLAARGKKALEWARKTVLEEEIESKRVREALEYFMNEYWNDITRPALLSLAIEAVGGDTNITTAIAVPMSLISGALDIHDDIIDQTKNKWTQPTVYGKFGKNVALLIGDALLFKGFALLHEAINKGIPVEKFIIICKIIEKMFFEMGDAEAQELKFRRRLDVKPTEYLQVVRKKAADVEAHTRIGSILGNGTKKEIEALSAYGRLLGMITILKDDLTDMLELQEFLNRINNEHLPLQVIYALEKSRNTSINSILLKKKKTERDVKNIIKFTNEAEGSVFVVEKIKSLANEASHHLKNIQINKDYLKILLETLVPLIIEDNK